MFRLMMAAVTSGGPPFRFFIDRLDSDTIITLLGIVSVCAALLIQNHDRGAKVFNDMTQSQAGLQKQVNDLENRIADLYSENQKVKKTVADQQLLIAHEQQRDEVQKREVDEDTKYIRSIAHWLRDACEVMDLPDEWVSEHPKPRLPDSIRSRIIPKKEGGEKK